MLYAEKYKMLLVNETWLHSGISSGLLDPESHYYVLRKDRNKSNTGGGGVCAFVSRDLHIKSVDIDERYNSLEILIYDLLCNDSNIRFFTVYRPPYRDITAV